MSQTGQGTGGEGGVTATSLPPARLAPGDATRVAVEGMRARPLRAALSGLGIALGIAALVAVVGLSESSKAQVNRASGSGSRLLNSLCIEICTR